MLMKPTMRNITLVIALIAVAGCTRPITGAIGGAGAGAAAQIAPKTAADCQRLRTLRLENTTIAVAEAVTGNFAAPGSRDTIRDLPPLCRVAGEIRPTGDSHIAFEVWLPLENWNGKFAGVGNGGWAGTISYVGPPLTTLVEQVRRGYATASTNTGHEGDRKRTRLNSSHVSEYRML